MKRIPFRAEEFISNEKTPVETFSNDSIVEVEITTTAGSMMERYPVEGLATFRNGRVHDFTWTETGVHDIEDPEYTDLNLWFSATPDVEQQPIHRVDVKEQAHWKEPTMEELIDAAYSKINPELALMFQNNLKEGRVTWWDDFLEEMPEGLSASSEMPPVIMKSLAITFGLAAQHVFDATAAARKGGAK